MNVRQYPINCIDGYFNDDIIVTGQRITHLVLRRDRTTQSMSCKGIVGRIQSAAGNAQGEQQVERLRVVSVMGK